MILTDREIWLAIERGQILVEPKPTREALSSTSLDLTLGGTGSIWKAAAGVSISPADPGYSYAQLEHLRERVEFKQFRLDSKSFVLGWTHERITLPVTSRLGARVEGKSSLARLGLGIHVTAPTVHAGFSGAIQLEIFNFGPHTLILQERMKICQLIFEQTMGTPDKGYQGISPARRPNSHRPTVGFFRSYHPSADHPGLGTLTVDPRMGMNQMTEVPS